MNIAIVFFYCDYWDISIQTVGNIMGSLAEQLLSQAHSMGQAVREMHTRMLKEESPISLKTAQEIIKPALQQFDRVYVCFDALDELQPDVRRQLMEFFTTVTGTSLRVFMTGRPNVEAELASFLADKPTSKIPIVANEDDINIYLTEKFSQDRHSDAMDETLQVQIQEKILKGSQGM
jgi:hypothetical protein